MNRQEALRYLRGNHRGVLATLKRDGRPQLSNVSYMVDADGQVKISVTRDLAKTRNVQRDPRVSMTVVGDNWYEYVVVEGTGRIIEEEVLPSCATCTSASPARRTPTGTSSTTRWCATDGSSSPSRSIGSTLWTRPEARSVLGYVKGVDPETGEILTPHKEVWARPLTDRAALAQVLAVAAPKEKTQHGGAPDRGVCPNHPTAGVLKRTRYVKQTTYECATCHRPIEEHEQQVGTTNVVTVAHAPIPQDAGSIDETTEGGTSCGDEELPGKLRDRDRHGLLRDDFIQKLLTAATDGTTQDALDAWARTIPLDARTDVAYGARR